MSIPWEATSVLERLMVSLVLVCIGIGYAWVSLAMTLAGGVYTLRGRPQPRWSLRGAALLLSLISGWLAGV